MPVINFFNSPDLVRQCADERSAEELLKLLKREREGKRVPRVIGDFRVKDYVSYGFQKLIYSYGAVIFNSEKAKKLLGINRSLYHDFSYFKLALSNEFSLGEFKKKIVLLRKDGVKKSYNLDYWERWSWSYLNSDKGKLKKILDALSTLGERAEGYPFEVFALGKIDNMKRYLLAVQLNHCPVCYEFIADNSLTEKHHAYFHDTLYDNRKYPILTQSVINLFALKKKAHTEKRNWRPSDEREIIHPIGRLTLVELEKLEKFLAKNADERKFVLEPYNVEYYRKVYDKFNQGKLDPLLKKALKGKVFYL